MNNGIYKISVALYVHGVDLNPDVVSSELGVSPSCSHRKGDRHGPNKQYERRGGMWALRERSDTDDLSVISELIEKIASSINGDVSRIINIVGVQSAHFDIFVATMYDEGHTGNIEYELTEDCVSGLGRFGLPVQITSAFTGNSLLDGLAFPYLIYQGDNARILRSRVQKECIAMALRQFKAENGFYPTTKQGLDALVRKPTLDPIPKNYPSVGYMDFLPNDHTGAPFVYACPGKNADFDLTSLGSEQDGS